LTIVNRGDLIGGCPSVNFYSQGALWVDTVLNGKNGAAFFSDSLKIYFDLYFLWLWPFFFFYFFDSEN